MVDMNGNPSEYEGKIYEQNRDLRELVKELLSIINRHGIDFDNEPEIEELLIKTGIQ